MSISQPSAVGIQANKKINPHNNARDNLTPLIVSTSLKEKNKKSDPIFESLKFVHYIIKSLDIIFFSFYSKCPFFTNKGVKAKKSQAI
ncbi:hypothetical protein SDC9_139230 [bioreactor metagenome]|uniref:Uncharacterized protein n=1 Tax=bioreactor metagenome TaxID=1076179 RepID=A0A645DRZ6_9ZZZZ